MNTNEIREIVRRNPDGFAWLPNVLTTGLLDPEVAFTNLDEGGRRAKEAQRQGFLIEALGLRVQHVEFWLRFLIADSDRWRDRLTFGQVIGQCEPLLTPALTSRLKVLNNGRNRAMHRYLLGGVKYDELAEVLTDSEGLDMDVFRWVVGRVGVPATSENLDGEVGAFLVPVRVP